MTLVVMGEGLPLGGPGGAHRPSPMTTLYLDLETYSECDLKDGTHAYAEHPSTEIMVAQYAIADGEPVVIDLTGAKQWQDVVPGELWEALVEPEFTVVAHNSAFDRTLLRHCWNIDVPIERWSDTMVKAMVHGLPGGLDKVGQILGLPSDERKDKRGKELIRLFCKPRPANNKLRRATRETHPAEWAEFLQYSHQDIVSMRAVDNALPNWNWRQGGRTMALWHLDQKINDRGFAVDLELAQAAIDAVAQEKARLRQETQAATDGAVSSPSKRDELLAHILSEYGVELPDMRADTLRRRVEDPELPEGVRLLISLRLEDTKTSTAKYNAVVKATSKDGRLRNTLQFSGAQRTGRWAGRIFQPQNMPRPDTQHMADYWGCTVKELEANDGELIKAYENHGVAALKGGFAHEMFYNVMALTSNLVRGCIVAPPGKKLTIADLSNIEGRGLACLAGETWKLKAFREFDQGVGADLYILAFARAFNVDAKQVQKWQRQIGKVMELGLGYEGGVAAFLTFAAVYQMDLDAMAKAVLDTAQMESITEARGVWAWATRKRRTLGLSQDVYVACEILKRSWRNAHPATTELWAQAGNQVKCAITNPGVPFAVGEHIKVQRDGAWLRVRLPSGRYLCYLRPEISDKGEITYWGVNQYTRQWTRIKTYGGKLVENWTQAWACDVLGENMPLIEACGYEIILSVHDELLTETPDTDEYSADDLARMMANPPKWAKDAPLAAAGFETYRYRKG